MPALFRVAHTFHGYDSVRSAIGLLGLQFEPASASAGLIRRRWRSWSWTRCWSQRLTQRPKRWALSGGCCAPRCGAPAWRRPGQAPLSCEDGILTGCCTQSSVSRCSRRAGLSIWLALSLASSLWTAFPGKRCSGCMEHAEHEHADSRMLGDDAGPSATRWARYSAGRAPRQAPRRRARPGRSWRGTCAGAVPPPRATPRSPPRCRA